MFGRLLLAGCIMIGAVVAMQFFAPPTLAADEFMNDAVERPPPRYPKAALDARIGGFVSVEVTIDTEGRVINAKVLRAEPAGWFEEEALRCVKSWRFRPGANTRQTVKIEFWP